MVKNLPSKSKTQCFLEVLAGWELPASETVCNHLRRYFMGGILSQRRPQPWTTILLGTSYKRDRWSRVTLSYDKNDQWISVLTSLHNAHVLKATTSCSLSSHDVLHDKFTFSISCGGWLGGNWRTQLQSLSSHWEVHSFNWAAEGGGVWPT